MQNVQEKVHVFPNAAEGPLDHLVDSQRGAGESIGGS